MNIKEQSSRALPGIRKSFVNCSWQPDFCHYSRSFKDNEGSCNIKNNDIYFTC